MYMYLHRHDTSITCVTQIPEMSCLMTLTSQVIKDIIDITLMGTHNTVQEVRHQDMNEDKHDGNVPSGKNPPGNVPSGKNPPGNVLACRNQSGNVPEGKNYRGTMMFITIMSNTLQLWTIEQSRKQMRDNRTL